MKNPLRRFVGILLASVTLLATPDRSFAWNAVGHMLVALVAYEHLTPPQREAMVALLKKHPRFKEDFLNRMPQVVRSLPRAAQDQWFFLNAAAWPDIVRGFKGDLRTKYHHSQWHYINMPIFLTDADRVAMQGRLPAPTEREWSPTAHPDPRNIAQAYRKCMRDLSDPRTSEPDRAVALCWVLHLIGDVHQPLHSCALFSRVQFPLGDHGGNYILLDGDKSLHSFWDGIMGSDSSPATLNTLDGDLKKSPDENRLGSEAAREMSFDRWIDESFKIAGDQVYTAEMRHIVKENKAPTDRKGIHVGSLSATYEKDARATARRRIVEAGFRLAKALDGLHAPTTLPAQ